MKYRHYLIPLVFLLSADKLYGAIIYSGQLNSGAGLEINSVQNYVYIDLDLMTASYSSLGLTVDYFFYGDGIDPINAIGESGNQFDYGGANASTKAYALGEEIDSTANWFSGPGFLSWEWEQDVTAYVGIQTSDLLLGWIEVLYTEFTWPASTSTTARILSFAYEDSGGNILAGDTGSSSVPLPASMSLMGLGLVALAGSRVRRRIPKLGQRGPQPDPKNAPRVLCNPSRPCQRGFWAG